MTKTTSPQPDTLQSGNADAPSLAAQIRQGRTLFLAMAAAYTLGNFNDNFMKQAVSLLALAHHRADLQGWVATLFTIPFLIFTSAAGWMADRFPRRRIIIISKFMELAFLSLAAIGVLTLNWPLLIAVIFLMAIQATIFGPALTGSIPDVYPESFVVHANARLKAATTGAILVGVIAAGLSLNCSGTWNGISIGRLIVSIVMVTMALIGVIVSFGVPSRPAGNPHAKFPWGGPLNSIRDLWSMRQDKLLITAILGDAYFWFLAALQVLFINKMGLREFHLNFATTSYLALAELLGVVAGALVAGKLIARDSGLWIAPPATAVLGVCMCLTGAAAMLTGWERLVCVLVMLALCGVAGGMMMVPLESFFQTRPSPERRGRVIAAAWFAGFVGILIGSMAYIPLETALEPTTIFMLLGFLTVLVAVIMAPMLKGTRPGRSNWLAHLICLLARRAASIRYRVKVEGLDSVASRGKTGILFLANHPALIDPVIVTAHLHKRFNVRPLALETQINKPIIKQLARILGVLPIAEVSRADRSAALRAEQSIKTCIEALQRGENILLYPAGRLMRSKADKLGSVSGAHQIISALPNIRVVLLRTSGLWGSSFGWAGGKPPRLETGLIEHLPSLLASGLCFAPKREVALTFSEPTDLPRSADRSTLNSYLDRYYTAEAPDAIYVPYSRWESGGVRAMPEPHFRAATIEDSQIPAATRQIIFNYLQAETGIDRIEPRQQLAADLGMDSLAVTDMIFFIEKEFAVSVPSVEALQSVADVLQAACGRLASEAFDVRIPPPPAGWMTASGNRVSVPAGSTIQEVFVNQAMLHPKRIAAADLQRGVKTYRDLITAVFAMRTPIAALDGQYVGILLPASVATDTVFLACLFAGKIPVMINWTVGERNIRHAMDLLGVKHIFTAQALLNKLASQGTDLSKLQSAFITLEEFSRTLGRLPKLSAAIRARFTPRHLLKTLRQQDRLPDGNSPAVVLFTSGSESLPKAVPLSHTNLLTNIRDALSSFAIYEHDRFLGMLPPFHSFGLTGNMLLPLLAGTEVVHHPNPNDVTTLAKITAAWRVSVLLGTPTFVANIMRAAANEDLSALRLCVTGAEKCPPAVYELLRSRCPQAFILEGYGITECSPIVSVVREGHPKPGSIGRPLPSVECAVVDPDTQQACPAGQTGMLLVRGPSIFSGYLNYNGDSPFVHWDDRQWYRTGDLVSVDADGDLLFKGRLKRFVKIGGEMVSLPAIEEALMARYPAGQDGPTVAVVSSADEDQPELVLFTTMSIDRAMANEAIRAAGLSGLHNIRMVRRTVAIPVLGTGKTDYRTLTEMLKAGGGESGHVPVDQ